MTFQQQLLPLLLPLSNWLSAYQLSGVYDNLDNAKSRSQFDKGNSLPFWAFPGRNFGAIISQT